ncbi:MAG: low-specificity L-threonine aldolase [Chloroflexi bacterium]|nr:low-specificity L-threonine aldolase [Chloroflexota bacterium]
MSAIIDLRSDTVSKPSDAMRRAMAEAEVGDDVFGDDPTVNRLEAMAAERAGKEAAVYVPSGTMANLISVMTHTQPGDEILLGDHCHIFNYEVAGAPRLAGVQTHPLPNLPGGGLDPAAVETAIREPNIHTPRNPLLCLENTHNRCGGAAVPLAEMDALTALAHGRGLAVHLDGARIFNAAAALGVTAARVARDCDTVSFCLSKGLGCPVGSLVCGPKEFIALARRNRKMLGGGMRQAGILAAAGIYALEHNIDRIHEDHENAALLAEGLGRHEVFHVRRPQTNIVVADIVRGTLAGWLQAFRREGVLAVAFGPARMRLVTHLNISRGDIEDALGRIARTAGAVPA